jgi:hypothetical protein
MSDSRAPRDPAADLRGRTVVDAEGQDCGWIQDVWVDAVHGVARLLVVEDAGLLGLGPLRFLLPAEAITQVQPYTVRIGQASGRIAGAPRCNPDRADAGAHAVLCGYYGYQPGASPEPEPPAGVAPSTD